MGFEPNSGMGAAALMYQKLKNEINSSLEKGKAEAERLTLLLLTKTNPFNPNNKLKCSVFVSE